MVGVVLSLFFSYCCTALLCHACYRSLTVLLFVSAALCVCCCAVLCVALSGSLVYNAMGSTTSIFNL